MEGRKEEQQRRFSDLINWIVANVQQNYSVWSDALQLSSETIQVPNKKKFHSFLQENRQR